MKERRVVIRKKLRLRSWIHKVILIVSALSLFVASHKAYNWYQQGKKLKDINDEMEVIATDKKDILDDGKDESSLVNPPENKESDYFYYIRFPFLDVDFNKLKNKNSDTVGYIKVNGTNINYPIVYSGDNTYYLSHAFDKTKNDAGWVFLDYRNNLDQLSQNTVIYGHGRLDSTVFGTLKNTLDKSWQDNKDNYVIRLSTPKYNYLFQIFSVYSTQAESYYITTYFSNTAKYDEWINTMKSRNVSGVNIDVNTNDKILTLSTCQNNDGMRVVVHAKLIAQENR